MGAGSTNDDLFLGIDLGTSGCRAIAIDDQAEIVANQAIPWPAEEQTPDLWWQGVETLFEKLATDIALDRIKAICVDGTSGTVLLTELWGEPIGPALMYNDNRAILRAQQLAEIAPPDSVVANPSSGLAKLLWLMKHVDALLADHFMHQADWVICNLCGVCDHSDFNNALKSGFDPVQKKWPDWLQQLHIPQKWLPNVVAPGTGIGTITPELAEQFGFSPKTRILAGTTDSTAAFIATGAHQPGDAVTSLGSTMVLKVISEKPIFDAEAGIYSQPLGDLWLTGGASNSGGRVLRDFFTDEQMVQLTEQLDFDQPTGLDYYPLPQTGERFPYNDPDKQPIMTPKPDEPAIFFQALLEGIASIEQTGYQRLAEAGAPYPSSVRSVGGGAVNQAWTNMRGELLNVPMITAAHTDAAYGVALLAKQTIKPTGKHYELQPRIRRRLFFSRSATH